MKLQHKVAIVTGANSGIGLAIVKRLVEEGAKVALAARDKEKLEAVKQEINKEDQLLIVPTDVSKQKEVESLVSKTEETFGPIDIYVNNAGVMLSSAIADGEVEAWNNMIDINIKGVLFGVNAVVPGMKSRGSGHIVNTTSVSSHEVSKKSTVYSATKHAVLTIGQGLEKELAMTGVRTTSISPGMVDTPLSEKSQLPNGRQKLKAEDIANAVIYAVTQPDYVNVNEIIVRPV